MRGALKEEPISRSGVRGNKAEVGNIEVLQQMPTTEPTHATESAPSGWIEKQYARTLEGLATDEDGLLYDRHVREHVQRVRDADEIAASEALAALRAAPHGFRTSLNRWLEGHGLSEGRLAPLLQVFRFRLSGQGG